ncbi:hypothetical protein [Streptomyces sp. NPDC056491]|uniref:hypothetical protein n=1 Tax=Streptomyces sp. NPDC056491 TaxID=3345837 RepID=UPI0036C6C4B9
MSSDSQAIGRHCHACGHPFTEADPVMVLDGDVQIHVSHSQDPRTGFYGVRAACDCGAASATPRPHSLDCAIHFPALTEEEQDRRHQAAVTAQQEYMEARPGFDPWSRDPEPEFTLYMTARVPELLGRPLALPAYGRIDQGGRYLENEDE